MSVLFILWMVMTQGVNFAFYWTITRGARGWVRTVGVYFFGYLLPLAAAVVINPLLHGGADGSAGMLAAGFLLFYGLWAALTLAMSKGSRGRRLFAILVCGVHQVGAFAFSLLAMYRIQPGWLGDALACLIMAGMGALIVWRTLPRVLQMDNKAGWKELNLTGVMNFILLFVTGIYPAYVPTAGQTDLITFLVANVVAIVYFPVGLAFAEKNRAVAMVRLLGDNTRVLMAQLAAMHATEEGARRVRHDARHHVGVLQELLKEGKNDEALRYLSHTLSHELLLPPSNVRWCGNGLVNSILTLGARQAKQGNLEFQADVRVPEILKMNEADLVALVLNLLENAVKGAAGGAVRVSVIEDRGVLRLGVSNLVPADFALQDGLPCAQAGVGITSVRAVVEKHQGLFDYVLENGVLTARVMIGGVA